MNVQAYRGAIAHCLRDPGSQGDAGAMETFSDGLLLVDDGRIARIGPYAELKTTLPDSVPLTDYRDHLIVPGFVDCHVHYAQTGVIAAYGAQLLEWLDKYTFPAETAFADRALAEQRATFFVDQLLSHGTTSALVFATVHPHSADAIFEAASARNMRLMAGKVLMDRHCPMALRDTPQSAFDDSRDLIEKWHGRGRLGYAITPRFAITSSPEQLAAAGRLAAEFPDVHIQTHLAEHPAEVARVAELFPEARSYLDVYERHGLLRERAVFAHCLHLEEEDYESMSAAGGSMAFCPSSNLFLGSGLFDLERARAHRIAVGLGSDVGGGTSLSQLRTLADGYKALQLRGQNLPPMRALYLATLGGAEALGMADKVGSFALGSEADFVVINRSSTEMIARRLERSADLAEDFFVQMTLGDDRAISATYVFGKRAYDAPER